MSEIPTRVLIAGIGGASLGTEIHKCLILSGNYEVFGCDISPFAYGHYQEGFAQTFRLDRNSYIVSVQEICKRNKIRVVIPGGEEPMALLAPHSSIFEAVGTYIAGNSLEVISTCGNKQELFKHLQSVGLPMPLTIAIKHETEIGDFPYPCVIKPAIGTGGSRFVFLASSRNEALLYSRYVLENCEIALVQEYIPLSEGEFTIGVLSLPDGRIVGSIAMQRLFHAKISVQVETKCGLISSGYSQGLIDEFPELRVQSEVIAKALNSIGPINIQARLRNGVLLPFEINPRFSASTYLRAKAGFNEIDIFLQYILCNKELFSPDIRPGYYLRSLSEIFVPKELVK
jgi:carbamoyl-phosphate synthase large subunit